MKLFKKAGGKKKDYVEEEFDGQTRSASAQTKKNINLSFKRKKKEESLKKWGRKERLFVFGVLIFMVGASVVMALSARSWKLPGIPRIKAPSLYIPFFGEETIVLEGDQDYLVSQADQEKAESVIKEFKTLTDNLSGVYGLYVVDLDSGYTYGFNQKETFQAASLIKLPIMASVYLEAEKGNLNLSDYLKYLVAMGKRSDNSAQIKVVSDLGVDLINTYIEEFGMFDTSFSENETTPYDIGIFFESLWDRKILDNENKDELLSFLTDTIYEEWITAGLPDGTRFAHKYGREVHVVNDAGIVYTESPYVVVIMSKGVVEREADEVFPELARLVYKKEVGLAD